MQEPEQQRLAAYLATHLAGKWGTSPFSVAAMEGGHSNLTYLVRTGGVECVLRRPPEGPLPPKAHDVAREYRWLAAVNGCFPCAPRPWLFCADPAVVGAPFFVMERRNGLVIGDGGRESPAATRGCEGRAIAFALVDTLVRLHAIDIAAHQIAALGEPTGFVTRQVRGWTQRWRAARTRDLREMDVVGRWLAERIPPAPDRPAIVHGDYKLDNVMLDAGGAAQVSAVLDWELAALGDPLIDLAVLIAYWPPTAGAEWPEPRELVHRYAAATGADLSGFRFYEVFALFRSAVIVQQLAARSRRVGDRERADALEDRVERFARRAWLRSG